jgi:hypothetical protein
LLRKYQQIYDNIVGDDTGGVAENETDDVDWRQLKALITETHFDPEDIHYRAVAWHQVHQLNRCLAALKAGFHCRHPSGALGFNRTSDAVPMPWYSAQVTIYSQPV